jgi:hypothetical protein
MDTDTLYATFTHPKVVTSMLLVGIGLGLALSVLMTLFSGQWYLPVMFAAIALLTAVLYMAWLDRQDFPSELEPGLRNEPGQATTPQPAAVPSASRPVNTDPSLRYAVFTSPRVVSSIILLGIGLGLVLCVLIILFRGTWYLPALFCALTVGMAAVYLYWLDGQDFTKD